MRSDGEALLVLRATVLRSGEKIFAREQAEASRRLRARAEQRLGRRRIEAGVRFEEERAETERGVVITLRAYSTER